jgi:platelet-activating factor acetylhydrolase IB subunit alpha
VYFLVVFTPTHARTHARPPQRAPPVISAFKRVPPAHTSHLPLAAVASRRQPPEGMVLTDKQRADLHSAILDYLRGLGEPYSASAAAFEREASLDGAALEGKGLLEKKWTSVVRLQRKVMDLEQKLEAASRLNGGGANGVRPGAKGAGGGRALPRAPPRASLSGHRSPVTCLAMHPVYSVVVSGSEDASVRVWDFESGEHERTLKGHTNSVQGVAFSPDGSLLASCSADISVKLWDFRESFECLRTLRGHDHNISSVAWVAGGDQLVSCSRDHSIRVWDPSTGFCVRTLSGHSDWVRCVAGSPDGRVLASGGNDQSVRLWDLGTGQCLQVLSGHTHVVECVTFSSAAGDKALLSDLAKPTPAGNQEGAEAEEGGQEAYSSAGQPGGGLFIASGSRDKTIRVWSALSAQCVASFSDHNNWVRSLVFHPQSGYLLSCSDDRSIRIFDLKTGRNSKTLEDAHNHFVTCLSIHPTLPVVVSGSVDKLLAVWDCS